MSAKKRQAKPNFVHTNIVINENTTLAEVISIPGAYETLAKLGVPCVVCPLMGMEMAYLTLGAIAQMYKLDLEKIIKELKNLQKKSQGKSKPEKINQENKD